jgi:hypothetical protein
LALLKTVVTAGLVETVPKLFTMWTVPEEPVVANVNGQLSVAAQGALLETETVVDPSEFFVTVTPLPVPETGGV